MRHNPNRNRPAFKPPLARQLYAWSLIVLAPVLTALFGLWIGGGALVLAAILQKRRPHNDDLSAELGQGLDGFEDSRY